VTASFASAVDYLHFQGVTYVDLLASAEMVNSSSSVDLTSARLDNCLDMEMPTKMCNRVMLPECSFFNSILRLICMYSFSVVSWETCVRRLHLQSAIREGYFQDLMASPFSSSKVASTSTNTIQNKFYWAGEQRAASGPLEYLFRIFCRNDTECRMSYTFSAPFSKNKFNNLLLNLCRSWSRQCL
jgi:hypothetical protein